MTTMDKIHFKDIKSNGLSDGEKTIYTFLIAFCVPVITATLLSFLVGGVALITLVPLWYWTLVLGKVKNNENERSVGVAFDQFTSWTIPTGLSWWLPPPIGRKGLTRNVDSQVINVDGLTTTLRVQTKDGGQVSVKSNLTWKVVDIIKSAKLPGDVLVQRVEGLNERQIRYFALGFESDSSDPTRVLMNQKLNFSTFITGDEGPHFNADGIELTNDIKQRAAEIGVELEKAEVLDVNPPQEVIDARNAQAAEEAEAIREKLNTESDRNRALEIMWGTHHKGTITKYKKEGRVPSVTMAEAMQMGYIAKKQATLVVSGQIGGGKPAGDFTTAEVLKQTANQGGN